MEALQVWIDYWNANLSCDDHDFAIVNVLDDVIIAARQKARFVRPSTISFGKTMTVVELADLLLPEDEGEHHHEQ
jgi:hypothetical protein